MNYRKWSVGAFGLAALALLTLPGRCVWAAADPSELDGPVAVMALLPNGQRGGVVELTMKVQKSLEATGRGGLLTEAQVRSRLSGGLPIGPGDADLEQLKGWLKQAETQSYNFEREKALVSLNKVVRNLDRLSPGPERWDLFERTYIILGKTQYFLKNKDAARRAFTRLLRTRPNMRLSVTEHASKTIRFFDEVKKGMAELPRSSLQIESDPPGAIVILDGAVTGETPWHGDAVSGRYHLQVVHDRLGGSSRWLTIQDGPHQVRFQLAFDGSLMLEDNHPAIQLRANQSELADDWWPWLAARLGVKQLVLVGVKAVQGKFRYSATLVDLEHGRRLREGWLLPSGRREHPNRADASDLVDFLVTGRTTERSRIHVTPMVVAKRSAGFDTNRSSNQQGGRTVGFESSRPWTRSWWPYVIAGGGLTAAGLICHLISNGYERKFEEESIPAVDDSPAVLASSKRDSADAWMGAAAVGYGLAATSVVVGLISHWTFVDTPAAEPTALIPVLYPGGAGFGWLGRF